MNLRWLVLVTVGLSVAAEPGKVAAKDAKKTPDIQGTWNLVSWERNGKKQELLKSQFFITESTIFTTGVALPDDTGFMSWPYEMGPTDKPSVAIMNLIGLQGRILVPALCELDGATLRIVLGRVTRTRALPLKDVKVDRPKEFATKPGSNQLLLVLKRAAAADDPILHLRKLGGSESITLATMIDLDSERVTNDDLAILKKFPQIYSLDLRRCKITDAGLVHVKDMANLEYLLLADMPITDAGLVHLEGMARLKHLQLNCAKITGAGLKRLTGLEELWLEHPAFSDANVAHLQGLTGLKTVRLRKTAITDAALVHLKKLSKLESLHLNNTKVTDAGLEHLKGLTELRFLHLDGTKVTAKGVRSLKAALPRLEIEP